MKSPRSLSHSGLAAAGETGPSWYDGMLQASGYRRLRQAVWSLGEPDAPYHSSSAQEQPSEHLLHLLWQQQELLRQPLTTLDMQGVTIYRPGRWARGSGPDFVEAKLRFDDGAIRVGAVEVHVAASDWVRHGHDRDPNYAQVLLHVVWRNDLPTANIHNVHGQQVPQLELGPAMHMSLAELQECLGDEAGLGRRDAALTPCQRSLQEMTPEKIGHLLDLAGEERWLQKANGFALKAERRGIEQALYELLLESLGFKGNRMPFWQLARLVPIAQLRTVLAASQWTPTGIQAVLYGVSGFLRLWQGDFARLSPDSRAYVEKLVSHWSPVAQEFPEHLNERHWRLAGIRPANFPQRRIAAVGYLLQGLAQHSLMDFFLAPLREVQLNGTRAVFLRCQHDLVHRLRVTGREDFWARRYTINTPERPRFVDLIGLGRAATMVIDVLLPVAAALVQLGQEPISLAAVRALYRFHPRLPANDVSREMMRQFFGADRHRAAVVNSACRQQALLQLYRDFCLNELESCQECAFPRLAARLHTLQTDTFPRDP
jgi:Protein of unknown function (DUF2851)